MFATRRSTLTALYWTTVVWTTLGLVSGVAYREFTKAQSFTGETQLAVLHTHLLALGTILTLVLIALEKAFTLSADQRFPVFYWAYNGGLALTTVMMSIKGSLQVLGSTSSSSAALAGIAGLGHILLTVGLVVLLMVLKARLLADEA